MNPSNRTESISIAKEGPSVMAQEFPGADLIEYQIAHHTTIDRSKVRVGYDDEVESPIHRVQNQKIVSYRTEEYSVLTDNQVIFSQGMYQFDPLTNQWVLCDDVPSLESDDLQIPSKEHMCIPERCQFVTWNVHSVGEQSKSLYSKERFREIFKILHSFLPDLICLQQVTRHFLDLLLEERWLRESNYHIILMQSVLRSNGQLILMKNFRPRAFQIYPLNSSENCHWKREYLIARFGLNSQVMIDLINLHLDCSDEERSEVLENFFLSMKTRNYMLIGTLNFGDDDIIEENIRQKPKYQIHDLWKEVYDLDESPGYTIDPIHNTFAQITSISPIGLRSDRYLLHKLPNLSYSISQLNMIGPETIFVDDRHINPSDHYALRLIIHFRIRTLSHRSALVVLPTRNVSPVIDQWAGYIHLFRPFFELMNTEDDEENLLLPLRLLLAQQPSFDIEIDSSVVDGISSMKLTEQSSQYLDQLSQQIEQLFPQCELHHSPSSMTAAQFHMDNKQNQLIRFPVRYLYILNQSANDDATSFHITCQLPLDSVLEPINLHRLDYLSDEIGEFFNRMNLYHDEKCFEEKQEKFNQLSSCFARIFNPKTVYCFTYAFFPYGSFRLGVHGGDLDTVFLLSGSNSVDKRSNLDRSLLQFRYDPSALNNHIIDVLEKHILDELNDEMIDCRKIQALYPIISIVFNDQTRVEIFVQSTFNDPSEAQPNVLSNFHQPIHGVHDIERLITYVRFPSIFQHLLTFVRTWTQNVGLYGQVYGYLGGYSWAILCAYICHQYLSSIQLPFSIENFFLLVKQFFSTYAHFQWSTKSISFYPNHSSQDHRGSMRILCPNSPFDNSARSTINSTRSLITQAFQHASSRTGEEILHLSNRFPDSTIQSVLQLTLSGQTNNELNQWLGYMKSRLAHFLIDCEEECRLFVQTDTQIERRSKSLTRFYSIGFQLNEEVLSCHREFYYMFSKFLDEFKCCIFRSETMRISYKLMSIHQWKNDRESEFKK